MQTFHWKYSVLNTCNLNTNNYVRPPTTKAPLIHPNLELFFLQECNTAEKENCSCTVESLFYPYSIIGHFQTLFKALVN